MNFRHESRDGLVGHQSGKTAVVPHLTCSQMADLVEKCCANEWGDEVDLQAAAARHLEHCPHCYGLMVEFEIGFDAAMQAAAEAEFEEEGFDQD